MVCPDEEQTFSSILKMVTKTAVPNVVHLEESITAYWSRGRLCESDTWPLRNPICSSNEIHTLAVRLVLCKLDRRQMSADMIK